MKAAQTLITLSKAKLKVQRSTFRTAITMFDDVLARITRLNGRVLKV